KGKLHVINPATATFVMAIGIFLFSAVDAFSVQEIFSNTLTIAYLVCGIGIYALLILQIFRRGFLLPFLKNPVNSFVTGSWIAGIATLCDVALKYFPLFGTLVQIVILLTSILWGGFVILYLYQFRQLYKNYQTYTIHGVILLSTVATQSIVIAWLQVFPLVPKHVIVGMIGLGVS
ncbi:hypothetical protein, partial [Streptomyces rhizosphaericus]